LRSISECGVSAEFDGEFVTFMLDQVEGDRLCCSRAFLAKRIFSPRREYDILATGFKLSEWHFEK